MEEGMENVQEHLEQVDDGMDIMRKNVSALMNTININQNEVKILLIILRKPQNLKKFPSCFDIYSVASKQVEDFFNFLWSFQKG